MFRKFGILGFALAVATMVIPSVTQARVSVSYSHPKGYYFTGGHWRPYRGPGYPYRGGYYDRRGRWRRY